MITTIDTAGRIELDGETQKRMGVQPGDQLQLVHLGNEWILRPLPRPTLVGLQPDGELLLHYGQSSHSSEQELQLCQEERLQDLSRGLGE